MHLFIFCCNWFSFGLEKTDFLLVVCCTLLLCSKTILEHPTFIWGTVIVLYGTCVDTVHPSKITTTSFCQEEFIFDLWLLSIWEMCMLWWCLIWWFHEKKLIQCSSPKWIEFYIFSILQITKKKGKEKPLLRRKSELPHDISMIRALESHKRSEEYLSTSAESQSANWDTKHMTLCHIEDHNATKKWRSISVPDYCKSIT